MFIRSSRQQRGSYSSISAPVQNKIERGEIVAHSEDTPSYSVLNRYGLLETKYRKAAFDDLFEEKDFRANSSLSKNFTKRFMFGYYCVPCVGCCIYNMFNTEVVVPAGHVALFTDNDNNYIFAQPGVHNVGGLFTKMVQKPVSTIDREIIHGNRVIVTISQGRIGYATDKGQPVLLPPGLHSWKSETMVFHRSYDLDDHVIEIGPFTIVTVDEGYAAITQDNGNQKILGGGETHLLTHQKWRFEKFITLKIQTDDLQKIRAASADNIIMSVNSTVVWRIRDVKIAARLSSETMSTTRGGSLSADISKLRKDVLKQAIASLASFIGGVNYSDTFHIAAAAQRKLATAEATPLYSDAGTSVPSVSVTPSSANLENPLFNSEGMSEAVLHANAITNSYGVEICSINIISANPDDSSLTSSLSSGAVASAAALQAETAARGKAKAMKIEAEAMAIQLQINTEAKSKATLVLAESGAKAEVLKAKGSKDAEILRAEGLLEAANLLNKSPIAVELERIKQSASALNSADKFFFGESPEYMSKIIMNTQTITDEE